MSQSFLSPLPTFTLESLVASRQWSAERRLAKKKIHPGKLEKKESRTESTKDEAVKE